MLNVLRICFCFASCCFCQSIIKIDINEAFNSTSRYLDDLLNIPYFLTYGRSDISHQTLVK